MSLTWMLVVLAVALIAIGAMRFDVIVARWRELFGPRQAVREAPPEPPGPPDAGLRPHNAPPQKPAFRRSGKRH